MINHTTATPDLPDGKTTAWKLIGSMLLFLGLTWLTLNVYAQAPSEAKLAAISATSSRAVMVNDASAVALGETTEVFTLTVLNTNDTWGYLDPCG